MRFTARCGRGPWHRTASRLAAGLLALVGSPESPGVAPMAAAAEAPASRAERVVLASWNLRNLCALEKGCLGQRRSSHDWRRLRALFQRVDADIMALQEVESRAVAERLAGPGYRAFMSRRPGSTQRVGFLVRERLLAGGAVHAVAPVRALDVGDLRYGMALTLRLGPTRLRLLAVHLKSGCFEAPLPRTVPDAPAAACAKLARQGDVLARWIGARVAAQRGFIVLGDFNRRFDSETQLPEKARLWPRLARAADPAGRLLRPTAGRRPACWAYARESGAARYYDRYIDHFLLSPRAARHAVPGSFRATVIRPGPGRTARQAQRRLSDHCPIAITLRAGAKTAARRDRR